MINLYKYAMKKVTPKWHEDYKTVCGEIAQVRDWTDPGQASADFLNRIVYMDANGVASLGQALTTFPVDERPSAEAFRAAIQKLKEGLSGKCPSDNVSNSRQEFYEIAGGHHIDSIFNRIVAGLVPDRVSPVIFDQYFDKAYNNLTNANNGYFSPGRVCPGDDKWYSLNVWMMNKIKEQLPDGPCEGACEGADVIDDFSRGIFVWGVHEMDWSEWQVLRRHFGW